jgi:hypothetical protein
MSAFLLRPTHYNIEKPILCRCHAYDVQSLPSNAENAFATGNSNCYVLNLNVVPLRSVPAILFNTSVRA